MKLLCYLCALVLTLASVGCKSKPKPNPAIAQSVEEAFKQRWIAKRMAELTNSGKVADAREARVIATEEFKRQFAYTSAAAKADPVSASGSSTP